MRIALRVLALSLAASPAAALDCEAVLATHGFLSKAQIRCGRPGPSAAMLAQVRDCAQHLSEARAKENLLKGVQTFDAREAERGHDPLCAQISAGDPGMPAH